MNGGLGILTLRHERYPCNCRGMQLKREFALWKAGNEHWQRGNVPFAIECFEGMDVGFGSRIAFNLGVLYFHAGRVEKAIENFCLAVSKDSYFALGHLALAKAYCSIGCFCEAKKATINCIDCFRLANEIDYTQLGMGICISKSDLLLGLQLLVGGKEAFVEFALDRLFELAAWKVQGLERKIWLGESVEIIASSLQERPSECI